MGWGAHLGLEVASGQWSPEEASMSINARELLAVEKGLHFRSQVSGSTVAVFTNNSTSVVYLCKSRGTQSPTLNSITQRILRWSEDLQVVFAPQFIMGKNNVLANSLSSQSSNRIGVGSQAGGVPGAPQEVAGDGEPLCHLVQSPLLTLFHSFP